MKRRLLYALLFASASTAQAQTAPIITAADIPAVGDSLRLSQAAPALPSGAPALSRSGANQTWNFAGLVPSAQRVARYNSASAVSGPLLQLTFNSIFSADNRATLVAPRSLPAAASALPVTDPLEFYASSSADFRQVGYGATFSGTAVPVTYVSRARQDVLYRFPLSFGGAATVSNSLLTTPAVLASNGFFSQRRQRTTQADGWGTLTTPFGTFQALRVVTSVLDHDSLVIGTAPAQVLDLPLQREYQWLASGVHVPLLSITTAIVGGQEVITSVEYRDVYRRFTPLATRSGTLGANLAAYPNPWATGTALRLALPPGSELVTVAATDVVGRVLFRGQYPRVAGEVVLDAATLGNYRGVLLLSVTTSQGTGTVRVLCQ